MASLLGRWRIVGTDSWDQRSLDLVAPAFIELATVAFLWINGQLLLAPEDDAYNLVIGVPERRVPLTESAESLARWTTPARGTPAGEAAPSGRRGPSLPAPSATAHT